MADYDRHIREDSSTTTPRMRMFLCGFPLPLVWKEAADDDYAKLFASSKSGKSLKYTYKGLSAARKNVLGATASIVGLILLAFVFGPLSHHVFEHQGFYDSPEWGGRVHEVTPAQSFWRQAVEVRGVPGTRFSIFEEFPQLGENQELPTTRLELNPSSNYWDRKERTFDLGPTGKLNVTWKDDVRFKPGQIILRVSRINGSGPRTIDLDPIQLAREGTTSYAYYSKSAGFPGRVTVTLFRYESTDFPLPGKYMVNADATVAQYDMSNAVTNTTIHNRYVPVTVDLLFKKKQYAVVDYTHANAEGENIPNFYGEFVPRLSLQIIRIVLIVVLAIVLTGCLAWALFSPSARRKFKDAWNEAESEENRPLLG